MTKAFSVWAIGEAVHAVIETFKNKYENIMKGNYHNELFKDSKACSLIEACKEAGANMYIVWNNLKE